MTFIYGDPVHRLVCCSAPKSVIRRLKAIKEKEQVMSANKPMPQEVNPQPGHEEADDKKIVQKDDRIPSQPGEQKSGEAKPDTPK